MGLPTIVVIPEHKRAAAKPKEQGIRLFTVHVRRGAPDVQDPNLNSHSKLNCITACIQVGADISPPSSMPLLTDVSSTARFRSLYT